jgi:hypothetical protein
MHLHEYTNEFHTRCLVYFNMRAQGYDRTASMSGIHRGVQASIRERILIAQYVHSKAYVLNLAIVHKFQNCR